MIRAIVRYSRDYIPQEAEAKAAWGRRSFPRLRAHVGLAGVPPPGSDFWPPDAFGKDQGCVGSQPREIDSASLFGRP